MKAGEYKFREDSRNSEFDRNMKICWSKGIVIVPVPTPSGYCKIRVLYNGKVDTEGIQYFSQIPDKGVSPLYKKIEELYKYFSQVNMEKRKSNKIKETDLKI